MAVLENKVAIVTGAAQGIGAAYAKGLAAAGAKLCVCDIIPLDAVVADIKAAGGEVISQHCDITDARQVEDLVANTEKAFGRVDILVNNAALFAKLPLKPFTEISSDEWDLVMKINTRGVFECVKAVTPVMRRQKYGKIINITSSGVMKGIPMLLHYIASKAAVVGMTRSLARELGADNICVNVLAPGLTMSEDVKANEAYSVSRQLNVASRAIKREQEPEDLVGTVVYLASPASDFMTGQTMLVDGGSAMI